MTQPGPPGTQAERTLLAWTRTSLSLLVGVIAVARLAAVSDLALGIVVGLVGAPLTIAALWTVNRRYRQHHGDPDGRLPALTAALAAFIGAAGLLEIALH